VTDHTIILHRIPPPSIQQSQSFFFLRTVLNHPVNMEMEGKKNDFVEFSTIQQAKNSIIPIN
jgi:hypothetical protein